MYVPGLCVVTNWPLITFIEHINKAFWPPQYILMYISLFTIWYEWVVRLLLLHRIDGLNFIQCIDVSFYFQWFSIFIFFFHSMHSQNLAELKWMASNRLESFLTLRPQHTKTQFSCTCRLKSFDSNLQKLLHSIKLHTFLCKYNLKISNNHLIRSRPSRLSLPRLDPILDWIYS